MTLTNWIFGPQLIGLIFFVGGIVQYYYPPKKINSLYGFRTPSSQRNQQTWDIANRFATVYMIKSGVILVVIGILMALLTYAMPWPEKTKALFCLMLFLASGVFTPVFLIVNTEKHIDKTFKE